ncbi:MAG: ATP-dependent DNA helicase [Thermoplasmata archaeon]
MSAPGGLFPYKPRPMQEEMVALISRGVSERACVVVEAGSGAGKTVCALAACLQSILSSGGRCLYLTRTNSQQVQVFRELRVISKKQKVLGLGIQGRHSTCLLIETEREWRKALPEELSLLCNDRKEAVRSKQGLGCPFYENLLAEGVEGLLSWVSSALPTAEEMTRRCRQLGICPYEASKLLARVATVVVAPYVYFLSPFIRARLLDWMNCPVEELIVVVDEAHNLPEFARQLRSTTLSLQTLKRAVEEAEALGGLQVLDDVRVPEFCAKIEAVILQLREEYLIDEDGLVPPGAVEEELMHHFKWTSNRLEAAIASIVAHGEVVREKRRKEGRLPRSHLHSLGHFLAMWTSAESDVYVKLIRDGEAPRLEAYCMDPSLAAEPLSKCRASIHMSGTLSPLEEYRDSLGLARTALMRSFDTGFPPEHRLLVCDPSVTMKYEERVMDEGMFSTILSKVAEICRATQRNTAVFFPSHDLLEKAMALGLGDQIDRKVFVEERGLEQQELLETIDSFKREGRRGGEGGVLMSVVGGRVSEGIDFPDRELEVAIIVGIPYPKPTARQRALQYFYDLRFGRGWDYTVRAPTARRMLQAIGRLIRSERDRGVAVILDRRALQFAEFLPGLVTSENPVEEVIRFWGQNSPISRD